MIYPVCINFDELGFSSGDYEIFDLVDELELTEGKEVNFYNWLNVEVSVENIVCPGSNAHIVHIAPCFTHSNQSCLSQIISWTTVSRVYRGEACCLILIIKLVQTRIKTILLRTIDLLG